MIFVSGPGYSCAITPAIDHAAAACSEGKEVPPFWKNGPLPLPWNGRSRRKEYLSPSTTTRLFNAASPARKPVSRQWLLCVKWLASHRPPPAPASAATPALERVL